MSEDSTITRSGYVEASFAAAKTWLAVEFSAYSGKKLNVAIARSADEFRQFGRVDINDGDKSSVTTPFAIMSIGSIALDPDRGGFKRNRVNNGIQTGADRQSGVSYHDDMRPAIVGIGLAFISDSIDDVFLFAEAMLYAAPAVTLTIVNEDTGYQVQCSLLIDGDLTIPPPDSDIGGVYRFEVPLRLRTYIGHSREMRLIRNVSVSVAEADRTSLSRGTIFKGEKVELVKETFSYQDLFDKRSSVYKYNHKQVMEGEGQ